LKVLRFKLASVEAPHSGFSQDSASPYFSLATPDRVTHRLDSVFELLLSDGPSEAARLPKARPPEDLVALAYASSAEEARSRGGSGGLTAVQALVEKHAEANDVPPALAQALVQVESSNNPKATGHNGEIGLLQIKPRTARAMGLQRFGQGPLRP
jgi:soluble lytic murein transglycosylase-like protein